MAEIRVIYDCTKSIEKLMKKIYKSKDGDDANVAQELQEAFQTAFDEGRRFQIQLNAQSRVNLTSVIDV
jgi:hypothetical protein